MSHAPSTASFTHLDPAGDARMVEVGTKPVQRRVATAAGRIRLARATIAALRARALPKGDVLTVAKIAAIQAAKSTSALIPLCHPLALTGIEMEFDVRRDWIDIRATVSGAIADSLSRHPAARGAMSDSEACASITARSALRPSSTRPRSASPALERACASDRIRTSDSSRCTTGWPGSRTPTKPC